MNAEESSTRPLRVLVFGTFDHLHPGHRFVIREALKKGETHVVVARDSNVQKIKGKPPEQQEKGRVAAIRQAFPEAHVILGDAEDFLAPVRKIRPDLILLGYDQELPPGVALSDLPCKTERLPAFEPEKWKSSLRRSHS